MAYNKHIWADGELITPQLMNNIENGLDDILGDNLLEALASSYDADNVYNNGDIVIYNNKMYKIIEDQVTGEWDEGKAEEVQIKLLINSETAPTRTEILRLSIANLITLRDIAESYDPLKLYHTGDYVIYNNILYQFITDSSTSVPNEFNPLQVTQVTIMDTFKTIVNDSFGGTYDKTKSYNIGDYVIYNNKIYKCIQTTTPDTFENNFEKFESTTLIKELINLNQIGINSEQNALAAEAYACGTQNGEDITSADDGEYGYTFENNAKYYSVLTANDAEFVEAYTTGKYKGEDITSDSEKYAGAFENNTKYYYEQIMSGLELVLANTSEGYDNIVASIGPAFNSMSHSYYTGDYFVHEGRLYKCIADFTASYTWDEGDYSSFVEAVNIGDELQSNINFIQTSINTLDNELDNKLNTKINKTYDDISAVNGTEIIHYIDGKYIDTNPSNSAPVNISNLHDTSTYACAAITCQYGDKFTLTGTGGNTHQYVWCFIESDGTRILNNGVGHPDYRENYENNTVITAPTNAAYLISNVKMNEPHFLCKDEGVQIHLASLDAQLVSAISTSLNYKGSLTSTDDILSLPTGIYRRTKEVTPVNWPSEFPDGLAGNAGLLVSLYGISTYKAIFFMPYKSKSRPDSAIFYKICMGSWTEWHMVKNETSDPGSIGDAITNYQNEETGLYDTTFSFKFELQRSPMVLGINAQYTGDFAPTVQYAVSVSGGTAIYTSPEYIVGDAVQPVCHEWRIPPIVENYYKTCKITITIPEGTTVDIKDIYLRDDQVNMYRQDGIKFHAHSGFLKLEPRDTIASFQLAAKLGFNSLITIPKFTADGVGICFHDDSSIGDILKWSNGDSITGEDNKSVKLYNYNELLQFDAGLKKGTTFAGMRVALLDDYFRICAMCNMDPILSIHPSSMFYTTQGSENWPKIKAMTDKYGITKRLWIKSGNPDVQKKVLSIFGTNIGGMVLIRAVNGDWDPLNQAKNIGLVETSATDVKNSIVPVVFEIYYSVATDELIQLGLDYGFHVSVCSDDKISGSEMKRLIGLGVTEFTQDYHCSMGLDW